MLTAGGRIALFWNLAAMPARLRDRLGAVYADIGPGLDAYSPALRARDPRTAETFELLRDRPEFEHARRLSFAWSRRYTTSEWLEQLATHSDHQTLPDAQRRRLLTAVGEAIDAAGGGFEMSYELALVTAERRSDPTPQLA